MGCVDTDRGSLGGYIYVVNFIKREGGLCTVYKVYMCL